MLSNTKSANSGDDTSARGRFVKPAGGCDHSAAVGFLERCRVPLGPDQRVNKLRDYVQERRAWIDAIEDRMRDECRITDRDFASLITYAGHWNRHSHFHPSWHLINFISLPDRRNRD